MILIFIFLGSFSCYVLNDLQIPIEKREEFKKELKEFLLAKKTYFQQNKDVQNHEKDIADRNILNDNKTEHLKEQKSNNNTRSLSTNPESSPFNKNSNNSINNSPFNENSSKKILSDPYITKKLKNHNLPTNQNQSNKQDEQYNDNDRRNTNEFKFNTLQNQPNEKDAQYNDNNRDILNKSRFNTRQDREIEKPPFRNGDNRDIPKEFGFYQQQSRENEKSQERNNDKDISHDFRFNEQQHQRSKKPPQNNDDDSGNLPNESRLNGPQHQRNEKKPQYHDDIERNYTNESEFNEEKHQRNEKPLHYNEENIGIPNETRFRDRGNPKISKQNRNDGFNGDFYNDSRFPNPQNQESRRNQPNDRYDEEVSDQNSEKDDDRNFNIARKNNKDGSFHQESFNDPIDRSKNYQKPEVFLKPEKFNDPMVFSRRSIPLEPINKNLNEAIDRKKNELNFYPPNVSKKTELNDAELKDPRSEEERFSSETQAENLLRVQNENLGDAIRAKRSYLDLQLKKSQHRQENDQHTINKLTDELNKLQTVYKHRKDEHDELSDDLTTKKNEQNLNSENIRNWRDTKDKVFAHIQLLNNNISRMKKTLENETLKLKIKKEELEAFEKRIDEFESKQNNLETDLSVEEDKLNTIQQEITNLDDNIHSFKNKINNLKGKLSKETEIQNRIRISKEKINRTDLAFKIDENLESC